MCIFGIANQMCQLPPKQFKWSCGVYESSLFIIDLHLIFEKSSLKNRTWFFVYFELDFWTGSKNQVWKRQKIKSVQLHFSNFSKIKCRSIGSYFCCFLFRFLGLLMKEPCFFIIPSPDYYYPPTKLRSIWTDQVQKKNYWSKYLIFKLEKLETVVEVSLIFWHLKTSTKHPYAFHKDAF